MAVLQYLFSRKGAKKCLFFFLFAVIPAAFIAYSFPLSSLLQIIVNAEPVSFGKLWISAFDRPFIPFMVVAAILTEIFISSCLSSALMYHMKIGTFGLPRFFSSVNNNFFPCLSRTFVVSVGLLVFYTIFILFASFWKIILSPLASIIVTSITLALLLVLLCYAVSSVSLWLPAMIYTGSSFAASIVTSLNQSRSTGKNFFIFYLFIALIFVAFTIGAYFVKNIFVSWALSAFSYILILVFCHVFWFIAFFDVNKITRADLSPYKRRN